VESSTAKFSLLRTKLKVVIILQLKYHPQNAKQRVSGRAFLFIAVLF